MSELRISMREDRTTVLGPGHRAVLWVQGCCRSCPGCIAEEARSEPGTLLSVRECAEWYLSLPATDGLTISGGEPMLQAAALAELITAIRERADTGVILYTGYTMEELETLRLRDAGVDSLLSMVDLLIDGPYIRELDDGRRAIGSSNQRLLHLTDRYTEAAETYYSSMTRSVRMEYRKGRLRLIGVPSRSDETIWRGIRTRAEEERA